MVMNAFSSGPACRLHEQEAVVNRECLKYKRTYLRAFASGIIVSQQATACYRAAPTHVDPCPAVQPKQWSPTAIVLEDSDE